MLSEKEKQKHNFATINIDWKYSQEWDAKWE